MYWPLISSCWTSRARCSSPFLCASAVRAASSIKRALNHKLTPKTVSTAATLTCSRAASAGRTGVTLARVFLQALEADRLQVPGHFPLQAPGRHGLQRLHLVQGFQHGGSLKGRMGGQRRIEDRAQRINVGGGTDLPRLARC